MKKITNKIIMTAGCLFALACSAAPESSHVIVTPQNAALLPIGTNTPMHYHIVCTIVNNSYPSSVAVELASPTDTEQVFLAKINGNPLIKNKGYLTRRENGLMIQPLASGWHKPIQLHNSDNDIAIQITQCRVVDS